MLQYMMLTTIKQMLLSILSLFSEAYTESHERGVEGNKKYIEEDTVECTELMQYKGSKQLDAAKC